MKKTWILSFVLMLSLLYPISSTESKTLLDIIKAGKIVIGSKADYPPWGFLNAKGQFEGAEVDMCHAIAEYLFGDPAKVELVAVTGQNRIPLLNSGKIDIIIATLGITEERKKVVDYSRPYFIGGVMLLVKKNSPIKSIKDLPEKKVITIKGTTGAQGLEKLVPNAQQIKLETTSEALQALRDDRGVAFAQDDILLYRMARENPDFKVVGEPFANSEAAVGLRKGEDDTRLYLDLALSNMYYTGFLKKSFSKYWGGEELDQYLKRIDTLFRK